MSEPKTREQIAERFHDEWCDDPECFRYGRDCGMKAAVLSALASVRRQEEEKTESLPGTTGPADSGCHAPVEATEEWSAEDLAELEEEFAAFKARKGWQPIETAPKDGTPLLLTDGSRIVDGAWNRGGALHMPHWMGGIHKPTHWMARPSLPGVDGGR